MGKKNKQKQQSADEQVEDIMAWGKSKNNYYQEEEQEYSQASQEQDQAKQLYENQYEHLNLNQEQFYQLPQPQDEVIQSNENDLDEEFINDQFLDQQIIWVAQLAKTFQLIQDEKSKLRRKVYDSYLLILMTIKQFKIPYLGQHPLVSYMPPLKSSLIHFQKQIPSLLKSAKKLFESRQNQSQNQIEEEINQDQDKIELKKRKGKNQLKIDNSGLKIYENIRIKKQEQKKAKKLENKRKRQQINVKAFKTVSGSEARLANEKILKNKGLMKRRSRGDGNSRIKLKFKYQKALIRRKAHGPVGVKQNPGRFYQGENKVLSGKITSTKLK